MTTFTRRTITHDQTTGLTTVVETTITGEAFEKSSGDSDLYEQAKLTRDQGRLLGFTPDSYDIDATIQPGDEVEWPEDSGQIFSVKASRHVRPDGYGPVISYAVVSA